VRTGKYNNAYPAYVAWRTYMGANDITPPPAFTATAPPTDPGNGDGGGCDPNYDYTIIDAQSGPLLNVTWGQSCTYNEQCPLLNCTGCNQNALTGCVATAMAQVIDYSQPTNSFGYNYASMPATSGNAEVERLMHDAGVSVNMVYGCLGSYIFTSNVPVVATSLINNFGFASANYVSGFDIVRCATNIENGWPVLLGGVDPNTNEGHEWVCDGYQLAHSYCSSNAYTMLHMNWGWYEPSNPYSPDYIGWYASNNWSVRGYTFSTSQSMIAEIHL
jgi:hypothetical protein